MFLSLLAGFFYAFHFLVPFLVLGTAGVHLILLHFRGRRRPRGLSNSYLLKVKFGHLFLYKDVINLTIIWIFWVWALIRPDWSADPVNFSPSDLSRSPIHIQPEWYFLHLYAVLRSIPNKLGGLIGFVLAIFVLATLRLVQSNQSVVQMNKYNYLTWTFLGVNLVLMWLGSQAVEAPYIMMGQRMTVFYFILIIAILLFDIMIVALL